MIDPVLIGDGITYERTAIQLYWQRHGQISPMTHTRLPGKVMIPNSGLRALIASIYPPEALGTQPDWLSFLPLDVVKRIIAFVCNVQTLCSAAQVCREWRDIVAITPRWQSLLQQQQQKEEVDCVQHLPTFLEGSSTGDVLSPSGAQKAFRQRVEQRNRMRHAAPPSATNSGGLFLH